MRGRSMATALAVAAAVSGAACGAGGDEQVATGAQARADVFFGWVLGTAEPTGVAIDVRRLDGSTRRVRAYVCDGLGPPRGKAVWFVGEIDAARANLAGRGVTMRSASRRERLTFEHIDAEFVRGTFTDSAGRRRQFVASPATGGAGIYDVTLTRGLRYTGTSTTGDRLSAQASRTGGVRGTITTASGDRVGFRIRTLSLAPVVELRRNGFSSRYRRDRARSLQPGQYVAVVAPGGSHWMGRSGNVRSGRSGNNIIGLDKAC